MARNNALKQIRTNASLANLSRALTRKPPQSTDERKPPAPDGRFRQMLSVGEIIKRLGIKF